MSNTLLLSQIINKQTTIMEDYVIESRLKELSDEIHSNEYRIQDLEEEVKKLKNELSC